MTKLSVCVVYGAMLLCYKRLACQLRVFARMCLVGLGTAMFVPWLFACGVLSNSIIRTAVYPSTCTTRIS